MSDPNINRSILASKGLIMVLKSVASFALVLFALMIPAVALVFFSDYGGGTLWWLKRLVAYGVAAGCIWVATLGTWGKSHRPMMAFLLLVGLMVAFIVIAPDIQGQSPAGALPPVLSDSGVIVSETLGKGR